MNHFEPDPTRYALEHGNREAKPLRADQEVMRNDSRDTSDRTLETPNAVAGAASAKTRKSKVSPTQRSLKYMRGLGYLAEVVEKRLPRVFITKDLYGFIDILCVKGEDIVGVQTTSGSNLAARVTKITEHENWPLICKAMRVTVHGWRKNAAGKWVLREVEL